MTAPAPQSRLYSAILQAQASFAALKKDSSNLHFNSQYASLAAVLEVVRPALNAAGVVLLQPTCEAPQGQVGVRTTLVHAESGEEFSTVITVAMAKSDAQGQGSALTYARRYALLGLLGLAPEDDDGEGACQRGGPAQGQAKRTGQQGQAKASTRGAGQSSAPRDQAIREAAALVDPEDLDKAKFNQAREDLLNEITRECERLGYSALKVMDKHVAPLGDPEALTKEQREVHIRSLRGVLENCKKMKPREKKP